MLIEFNGLRVGGDEFLRQMRGGGERRRVAKERAIHEPAAVHINPHRLARFGIDGHVRRERLELGRIARGAFDRLQRASRQPDHAEIVMPREFQRTPAGFLVVMVVIHIWLVRVGLGGDHAARASMRLADNADGFTRNFAGVPSSAA